MVDSLFERHRIRRELEFDSQNELPDAGVFLAGRMNRTQIFGFNKNQNYICAKIRDHQAIGVFDKEGFTQLPVSPSGWLRSTATCLPHFQRRCLGETKGEGFRPLFLSHQGLEGPI